MVPEEAPPPLSSWPPGRCPLPQATNSNLGGGRESDDLGQGRAPEEPRVRAGDEGRRRGLHLRRPRGGGGEDWMDRVERRGRKEGMGGREGWWAVLTPVGIFNGPVELGLHFGMGHVVGGLISECGLVGKSYLPEKSFLGNYNSLTAHLTVHPAKQSQL